MLSTRGRCFLWVLKYIYVGINVGPRTEHNFRKIHFYTCNKIKPPFWQAHVLKAGRYRSTVFGVYAMQYMTRSEMVDVEECRLNCFPFRNAPQNVTPIYTWFQYTDS